MPIAVIVIHDLPCPGDPLGRTYREVNLAIEHSIGVGSLVEILPFGDPPDTFYTGIRLRIMECYRDCDGTPLYSLGASPGWDRNHRLCGFPADTLRVIEAK
jgi:hypothetical protein